MHYIKKLFGLILIALIVGACSRCQTKLSFTQLTMLSKTDTIRKGERQSVTRIEQYLVENFCDNKEAEKQIDSFAFKSLSPDFREYPSYHIIFYRKTSNTTVEAIRAYKKGLPPESLKDEIYEYWWLNGNFLSRHKFKDGKLVDPDISNIEVKPVSDDSLPNKLQ